MKRFYQSLLLVLLFVFIPLQASETIYSNAEDTTTNGWFIYDATPEGANITNTFDTKSNSRVITLSGSGIQNGYALGNWDGRDGAWNNQNETLLSLDLRFNEYYNLFVILDTTEGRKYLYYTAQSQEQDRGLIRDDYIHIGLGSEHINDTWYTESRDLSADLHRYAPDVDIIAVNGVLFRGSGSIDNVTLSNNQEVPSQRVIEDAEDRDTATWSVYDNSPKGASIENIYDASNNSQVIQVRGEGTQNGYIVGNWAGRAGAWNEREHQKLSLNMNFPSGFNFFVTVQTTKGSRYLYYSSDATDRGLLNDRYIHHGLGSSFVDGNWHTFSRDLQADLQEYEADNSIIAIDGLLIRGSGMIDDITLFSEADQEDTSVKIFIIGDSTVHNTSQGEAGWGSKLGEYTDENVIIFNQARSGSSSKSYKISSASHHDWTTTKSMMADADISHGAYLFIQFGHNDEKKDEYLHTEAGIGNSFYTHLKEYVDEARTIGVIPVLITSVERMYLGASTHGDYPQTVRDLAIDENVLLIDLQEKSWYEFNQYESHQAIQDVFSYDDSTHFNPEGASIVAGWVKALICSSEDANLCSLF